MALDLGKLVRVETLFKDICMHLGKQKDAEPALKEQYALIWLSETTKHKDNLFEKDNLSMVFLVDYSKGAADAFVSVAKICFPGIDASRLTPGNPSYYIMLLNQVQTIDLLVFLGIADKALHEVGNYYQGTVSRKIKTQLDDKELKQYFLEEYDKLFREKGYEIVNCRDLEASAYVHYLFLLADNKMEEVLKRQIPGMEQIKRYGIIIPKNDDKNTGSGS